MSGSIGIPDPFLPQDDASGRKIRSLNKSGKFINRSPRLINEIRNGITHLAEIMWRDIGRHPHCNAGTAIKQQVGQSGGQNFRLLETVIKVGHKVHGILIYINQHLFGNPSQARLSVTHSCRGVIIHATKITLSINQ
ncbi:hypothetical protein ES703_46437 [subsurface metagenome]